MTQPGRSGQFDVVRGGDIVFSKQQSKRFPKDGEVLALLRR